MKKLIGCLLGAMLLLGGISLVGAQENSGTMSEAGISPPPKVLQIIREFTKPGKSGAIHEKSESGFVQAYARAKWPSHYFAATSITGKSRALFFVGYDSYASWEKDAMAQQKNAGLSAALDRASMNDGDLLSEIDTSLLRYDEEQSLRAPVDIAHMRYFEISLYRVRPGHRKEWSDLVKLVKDGYDKVSDVHWAMYDADYGQEDVTYVVIIPLKSAAEIDESESHDKQFREALGEDGMKKLTELESSAVEFYQTNLFQFAPSMSYPPDAWVKADPDFWKVKAAPAAKAPAKTEEKPAAKQ